MVHESLCPLASHPLRHLRYIRGHCFKSGITIWDRGALVGSDLTMIPLARHAWKHAPIILVVVAIAATCSRLFLAGTLYLGDSTYDSAGPPILLGGNPFASYVSLRNVGYSTVPFVLRWPSAPQWVIATLVGLAAGNYSYSKLTILLYLVLAAVGIYGVLLRFPHRCANRNTVLSAIISLGYALNPLVLESVVRGYLGVLVVLAFLPWIVLSYQWMYQGTTARLIGYRSLLVSILIFATVDYTYALVIVICSILTLEVTNWLHSRGYSYRGLALRFGAVGTGVALLELPVFVGAVFSSPAQYLNGGSSYLALNTGVNILSVLSLTSGSWGTEYFTATVPLLAAFYVVLIVIAIALIAGIVLIDKPRTQPQTYSLLLLLVGASLALGPVLPFNQLWSSVLLESFELLPLVAFSIALLAGSTLTGVGPLHRNTGREPTQARSINNAKRARSHLIWLGTCVFVSAIVVSSSAVAVLLSGQFDPARVPTYDTEAYDWVASEPGSNRMLLVPPTYAIEYPFNSGGYSFPVDYWTTSPPKPVIIDDGGTMGGLEGYISEAFYTGDQNLFYYLLNALDIQFIVVRTDAVSAWNVPYGHEVNASFVAQHFPALSLARTFGPILVYEYNQSSLFTAVSNPIVIECFANSYTQLGLLTNLTPAYTPLIVQPCNSNPSASLATPQGTPVLINETTAVGSSFSSGFVPLSYIPPTYGIQTVPLTEWLHVLLQNESDSILYDNASETRGFVDNFSTSVGENNSWTFYPTPWSVQSDEISSPVGYAPWAIANFATPSNLTVISANVDVASGFAAGLVVSSSNESVSRLSFAFQVVPSWQSVVFSEEVNGSGKITDLVHFPSDYNSTYSLELYVARSSNDTSGVIVGYIDGVAVMSQTVPMLSQVFGGLTTSQGLASFSSFNLTLIKSTEAPPWRTYANSSWGHSEVVYPPAGPDSTGILITTGPGPQAMLASPVAAPASPLLYPDRALLNVVQKGAYQWNLWPDSSGQWFVAASLLDDSGWSDANGSPIVETNFFALGFRISGPVTLVHNDYYSLATVASTTVFLTAVVVLIPVPILVTTLKRHRGPRMSRFRLFYRSSPSSGRRLE